MYRDLILPRARQLYRYTRENSTVKVFLHSCGAIYDFLPDLIDAGVEVINPVQTSAAGMDPKKLKNEFGKDLVFWGGGIDTQHTLPEGNPAEVKAVVEKNCRIFMPGGGFIYNQIHNMLDTVPPENIVAMYEAVNSISY
jgi:uroporphyrinogen decarboxylase